MERQADLPAMISCLELALMLCNVYADLLGGAYSELWRSSTSAVRAIASTDAISL
jgi:hypothetical protein